jgi:hypothetical protein
MKLSFFVLLLVTMSYNSVLSQDKMQNLKFIRYIDGIDCSNNIGVTVSLGDTLIFMTNDYDTRESYLNICFNNKCLKFSKKDLGIDSNEITITMVDAVHCNKNNNDLWIATRFGIMVFDGQKCYLRKDFDSTNTNRIINSFYKDTNGNILINTYNISLFMYDGTKFNKLDFSGDIINGPYPGTRIVEFNDKLYYINILGDLAYYDSKNKTYNSTGLSKIIDSLYIKKIKPSDHSFIQRAFSLKKNKIFFTVSNVMISKIFYYNEKNLEVDNFIADSIFSNDSLLVIPSLFFDKKGRKWVHVAVQKALNTYSTSYYFVIDSNNNYYRINLNDYDIQKIGIFTGLHEFSNGTTYLGLVSYGFLVEDPLGVSVDELNSKPSFFLTSIKPNPFKDRTRVEIISTQKAIDNLKAEIFDCLGKSIKKVEPFITYYPYTGNATLDLETDGILPGFYYLVLNDGNDTRTMPIIIK